MKYQLVLFVLFLFASNFLFSQRGLEAGAAVQPQIYGQLFDEEIPGRAFKIPYSFAIGIDVGYNLTDNLGLRTGFMYSPQGDKFALTNVDPEQAFDLKLDYIQVPLYLKLNSSVQNTFSFILLAGPHFSFLNDANLIIDEEDEESVLGDYKRTIIGASGALGLQMNLDEGNINFLWRTSTSLNSIQENAEIESNNICTGIQLSYHYFLSF